MRTLRQVKCFAIIVSWSRHHTKIGEVHFRLLGTNGSHAKLKSQRFTAAGSRFRQNLKYENSTSSIGRLRQKIAP